MTRKLFSLLLALLLLMQLGVPALATESAGASAFVRSAYWTDEQVHVFTDFNGTEDPESLTVSLMINNQVVANATPQTLGNAQSTVHYLFLVDRSLSMGGNRSQVLSFLQRALKAENTDFKVSVASFDSDYELLDTGLETYSQVRSVLWDVTYNREESDICGALAWAVAQLGEEGVPVGDVSNVVLITDGTPQYSSNPSIQSKKKAEAAQNASAMMAAYPDVTVHTVCFGSWDADTQTALAGARGLNLKVSSSNSAREAGDTFAAYTDGLCLTKFPLKAAANDAYLTGTMTYCVGKNLTSMGAVRNIAAAAPQGGVVVPVVPNVPELAPPQDPSPTEPVTDPTVPVQPAGEEGEPTGETTEPIGEETDPTTGETEPTGEETDPTGGETEPTGEAVIPGEDEVQDPTDGTGATDATDAAEPDEPTDGGMPGWLIGVIIAAVVLVGLAAVVLLKKSRAPAGSVRMRMDVICGNVTKLKKDYYLTDQILIGTDKRCHIVIDDPGAAGINTRIFKQGQMIYIEDMDSPGGTLLGGMRLYSSNRLRSGDEVTIGTVTLRILF